jgi:hypothetical protein
VPVERITVIFAPFPAEAHGRKAWSAEDGEVEFAHGFGIVRHLRSQYEAILIHIVLDYVAYLKYNIVDCADVGSPAPDIRQPYPFRSLKNEYV